MHGQPLFAAGFSHFPYVNPDAPKGGRFVQGLPGTFDSLNPFIVKGLAQQQVRGYITESLLVRGYDEPFTLYGLLARTVETDEARSYITFELDPDARFSDGSSVTPEDVIFSWQILRDQGRPNFRAYYSKVVKAEAVGERSVRFDLNGANDRELPLILGLMPILAKHAIDPTRFDQTSFAPLMGSGPYLVGEVKPGESVTFKRRTDYWGRDRAVNKGFWNFDEIRFEFYRDGNSEFEAFKKGLFDLRYEIDPSRWENAYDFPAVRNKRVIKEVFPTGLPKGMAAFVFNTRRPIFADIRVREALGLLFDFHWVNHNLYFDDYRRTTSYFEGSELSSHGHPADARERTLLAPFPDAVRPDVLEGKWSPPETDGSGRDRTTLKKALGLLAAAGFEIDGTELRERATGKPFTFEILVTSKDQERLALAYSRDLKRAGIRVKIRVVDAVQYDQRCLAFDFDMIQYHWSESLSPGNEQSLYWGSAAADAQGSRNYMGVRSKAVDEMISAILAARGREDFVAAVRALDRILISGFFVVPLFNLPDQWVARWAHLQHPAHTSLFGYLPETWWHQQSREAKP
ncbi:MAG TPA: extracellular solute-binding protein [Xanthobacteraceae bacterium]|nr:extracellular solute-binding protein [Xanthobacteraceae bacterium]